MPLICKAIGCRCGDIYSCERCNAYIYGDFIEPAQSWFGWWFKSVWWLERNRWKIHHHCDVCNRPMLWTGNYCCSEKCYKDWIPF